MESYSLLILFALMVVIWWFTWAPWRKDNDDRGPDADDTPQDGPGRPQDGPGR